MKQLSESANNILASCGQSEALHSGFFWLKQLSHLYCLPVRASEGGIVRLFRLAAAVTIALNISYSAEAQENGPIIVSERVQEIALEFPISERLGIESVDAGSAETGRYLGLLASTEIMARQIAIRNDRDVHQDEDYRAAFIAFCCPDEKKASFEPAFHPC